MIRINLLKKLDKVQSAETNISTTGISVSGNRQVKQINALLKVLIIILPLIGFNYYENNILEEKKLLLSDLQVRASNVNGQFAALGGATQKVAKFNKERESIDKKITLLESLSKDRLDAVVALDNIQIFISDRVWLTDLTLEGRKINIAGYAFTEDNVRSLVGALEESVIFSNITYQNSLQKNDKTGELQVFTVDFDLETI